MRKSIKDGIKDRRKQEINLNPMLSHARTCFLWSDIEVNDPHGLATNGLEEIDEVRGAGGPLRDIGLPALCGARVGVGVGGCVVCGLLVP